MNCKKTCSGALLSRKYWEFFVPTILMAMTTTMSIVVDSIIVGNLLGAHALAAVNLVLPVVMLYTTVAVLLGLGAATVISIALGEHRTDDANRIFTAGLVGLLAVGFALMVGQAPFVDEIAGLITQEAALRPLVREYLHILVYGAPIIVVTLGATYCLRVDGWVKLASAVLVVANVVNLILDLVYMGPLKLGIAGSSLATVSGYAVGAVLFIAYAVGKDRTLRLVGLGVLRPRRLASLIRTIVATGFPAATSSMLITIKIMAINAIVLGVAGPSGMVAFSVCLSCLSFVSMFISGAAQSMMPIIGVLYGEGDHRGIRFVVRRAVQVLSLSGVTAVVLLEAFPGIVLHLFGVRDAVHLAEGETAIRLFAVSLLGTSFTFPAMYFYMTIGRRLLATAISVVQGVAVLIPAAYLLSGILGASGIWVSFSLAEAVTLIMILVVYRVLRHRDPITTRDILLLDESRAPQPPLFEASIANTEKDVAALSTDVAEFLRDAGLTPTTASRAQDCIEVLASNVVRHAYPANRRRYADIRIQVAMDAVTIALRDGGARFDPKAVMAKMHDAPSQDHPPSGLLRLKVLAETVTYTRAAGCNMTTLVITPEPA